MKEQYMNLREIASYIRLSIPSIYRLLKVKNGIPAHRTGGKRLFIQSEVDDWVRHR